MSTWLGFGTQGSWLTRVLTRFMQGAVPVDGCVIPKKPEDETRARPPAVDHGDSGPREPVRWGNFR
jgi:hypothetical protein